jgi:soluble lytic murein transglycosylase-like protein
MKLDEVLDQEQLDEIKLRHVLAGAALGAALTTGAVTGHEKYQAHKHEVQAQQAKEDATKKAAKEKADAVKKASDEKAAKDKAAKDAQDRVEELTKKVLEKYKSNIKPHEAKKVVKAAIKHEMGDFKAEDMLALIGVESSFKKTATSNLANDKAVGLTQIRPKIWNLNATELAHNVDKQISKTYEILADYKKKLGNKEDAYHAYNIGLTNFRHEKGLNPAYPRKIKTELSRYI